MQASAAKLGVSTLAVAIFIALAALSIQGHAHNAVHVHAAVEPVESLAFSESADRGELVCTVEGADVIARSSGVSEDGLHASGIPQFSSMPHLTTISQR